MLIIQLAILVYSVILHEISHGLVADRLGDPTARLAKRLTLNPIPHIDPLMTIAFPLILLLTGAGIIFGAAKPVPIDPFNFKEPKKDSALVALAGPAANIAVAVFAAILVRLGSFIILDSSALFFFNLFLTLTIQLNLFLALFNLFPIPPLDGSKVLAGILPDDLAGEIYKMERFGFLLIFAVLIFFPNLIFGTITPIMRLLTAFLLP